MNDEVKQLCKLVTRMWSICTSEDDPATNIPIRTVNAGVILNFCDLRQMDTLGHRLFWTETWRLSVPVFNGDFAFEGDKEQFSRDVILLKLFLPEIEND